MEYILITAIALIVLAGIIIFLYLQNNILDITQYNIKSNDCGSLKIVQLSDLHSKPFNKVLKKTQEIDPDIICITGDYINDKCKNKDKMLCFGKELVKIAKVYYITGNHERRLENFESIMQELSDIGFIVLLNRISVYND